MTDFNHVTVEGGSDAEDEIINLPTLPVSGLAITYDDGITPLPEDILGILAGIEATEAAAQARREVQLDPVARASAVLAGYAEKLLILIKAWCLEHHGPAEARSLPLSADAFARMAETVDTLQETLEDHGLSPSIAWGATTAYEAAFKIISRRPEPGHFESAAFDQEYVAETSPIRELCSILTFIAEHHAQMIDGDLAPAEALLACAEIFSDAPSHPRLETP
jgi:hypothetical protein